MDASHSRRVPPDRISGAKGRRAAVIMLLLAAFFWGSGNVANKTVLQDINPFAAVFARNLVAMVVLLPFALGEFRRLPHRRGWAESAVLPSVLFAVAIIVQQWGFQSATVTNASFLVNTACVLTPLLAFVVLREPINLCIGAAAVLTLMGVFMMSGLINGAGQFLTALRAGDVACLVSAVFYAGWMVALSRHATVHGRPLATIWMHCALTAVSGGAILLFLAPQQPGVWVQALPEILYLGVFSTAIAFGLTAAAQARVSASTAAVLVAAESLFGAAGAILVLGERPGLQVTFGAGVMLFAIFIVARAPAQPAGYPNYSAPSDKGLV